MKLKFAVLLSSLVVSGAALAQAKAPEPDWTLAGNASVVTDYRYRGISQSRLKPALQGGLDLAHSSGLYLGTWGSSIKWIKDGGGAANFEADFYGGYKFAAGPVAMDVGVLRYIYAGSKVAVNPDTTEVYVAGTYGPATLKYSHSTTNLFGFASSKGSGYLDLNATFDLGNGFTVVPHIGYQKVKDNSPFSYYDYSVTLNKDFGNGLSGSLMLVDTDTSAYVGFGGKDLGKAGIVLGLKYTF
jgi:uncharacterized protein (TIGR02001 family)